MAKISYVKAWGLWSHYETVFNFSPGLTVITGPNGSGKSTLIRIIRWVALGEPSGEDFIFTLYDEQTKEVVKQAEEGKAEIGLDNGVVITKTRRKGKTTYTVNTIPEPFEKAEVPQDVKDILGIRKHTFGDFETYLNFAFQMEAPFLLSEVASTGAKVLGKLAGTEAVDLAIAEVSRKTHKARDDKRIADRDIEKLNGDLLDYQDVDDLKQQVAACEYLLIEVEAAAKKKDSLVQLMLSLETAASNIVDLTAALADLEIVPSIAKDLEEIEKAQQRYNHLLNLLGQLETIHGTIEVLSSQLLLYDGLGDAEAISEGIERKANRLEFLTNALKNYNGYVHTITECGEGLSKLTNLDVAAADLAIYEKKEDRLLKLKNLVIGYTKNNSELENLQHDIEQLKGIEEATEQVAYMEVKLHRLSVLNQLQTLYADRCIVVAGISTDVKLADIALDSAKNELTDAWAAAGGKCPLCEQPISTHAH